MNVRLVGKSVAGIVLVVGLCVLSSVPVARLMGDSPAIQWGLARSAFWPIAIGCCGQLIRVRRFEPELRDGLAIVAFSWIFASAVGSIPFVVVGGVGCVDAFFETASGFTTTGASIYCGATTPAIEALPKGLLYWRAMTHWLGGMGIVVLSLAVLPFLSTGGMHLYKAEVPGPLSDRLAPRIANAAKMLYGAYLVLSAAQTLLLWAHPAMDLFEAWCHTCATMATGGFSTRNASILAFNSAYIEWVIIVFMFLAGANFSLHLKALRGEPLAFWKDEEFRLYLAIVVGAVVTASISLFTAGAYGRDPITIFRHGTFAVVSIMTTTGFVTEDFDTWSPYCRALLLLLMFVGGCGGSTGGGIKVSRILLLLKGMIAQVQLVVTPHRIQNIWLGDQRIRNEPMVRQTTFFFMFILTFVVVGLALCLFEPNLDRPAGQPPAQAAALSLRAMETAFGASAATLCNVGPGLALVGPTRNYAWMAPWSKLILSFAMLIGRLELFTILVLFLPGLWRR
ncbi:MAG: TrkH family potassium uptake protein [Candidatus Riflebacteria bacterium]|nr:TrkH family potassium uptake protein [Candidatus Riflebacteria bacterium]